MHIVLIRHGTRIDKSRPGVSPDQSNVSLRPSDRIPDNIADIINQAQKVEPQREEFNLDVESSSWLSNFDPPLNQRKASEEMDSAFKKISTNILGKHKPDKIMIHSSPYNRCIQTSELLLDKIKKSKTLDSKVPVKLRVDQALSEWLNENYNLKYLPPNDDGYSMINNVNAYLNQEINENDCEGEFSSQTRHQLRDARDFMWSYNQLGHCGEYGESASSFTRRCFYYLIYLLQFYYTRQDAKADRNMVVFIVSHGAVISTLLQILLGRSVFNEIPLCTPIYFKQSEKRRSVFKLMDYDFNLYQLLSPSSDQEFYKILDTPIELTKLDPENLRSELTIGTTGYTTIIQSIPKKPESTQKLDVLSTRRRRNTINIGDKEHHEDSNQSLKQTLSSRQLYRLNKDTNEEKVIDLDKLHSYFGGDSESDSDEEVDGLQKIVNVNDFDDHGKSLKNNIYKGSITSLSSFNEENKSKFQLNDKNFYSKQSPIESDPYSHFFLERSSTMEHNGEFDSINMTMSMSRKSSQGQNANVKFDGLTGSDSDRSIDTEEYESDSGDEPILSFGTKDKIQNMVNIRVSDESNKENTAKPYITGTFGNVPLKGGKDRTNSVSNTTNAISSTNMGSVMGCSNSHSGTKLAIPKLISTRNMNLLVRGGDSEESMTRTANNSNSILKNLLFDQKASPFGEDANSADDDDDDEDSGWFGGFSR